MDLIICLCLLINVAKAVSPAILPPSNVTLDMVSPTVLNVTFDAVVSAVSYEISITQRQNATDWTTLRTTVTKASQINGLKSNIVYDVSVRARGASSSWSNYSDVASARTAPAGCSITNSFSTPTFITIFLEQVPGATIWNVEYTDTRTGQITKLVAPTDGPTKSNYLLVLKDLSPNTVYSVRARIANLSSSNLTEAQSPYGKTVNIATEKLSVFGRVILRTRPFNASISGNELSVIASELTAAYQRYSHRVYDVSILELENATTSGNTLCHHEIYVTDQTTPPTIDDLILNDTSLYASQQVHVAGTNSYYYDGRDLLGVSESSGEACVRRDKRSWIFHNDLGASITQPLPRTGDAQADSVQRIRFAGLGAFSSSTVPFFTFAQNSVYGIEHDYLVKGCTSGDPTMFYDRVYLANSSTTDALKYAIVYTTGPGPMNNDINSVDNFPIDTTDANVKVRFNHPRVSKAIHYQFLVTYDDVVMTYMERREWEIDNSERIQITTGNYLTRNTAYNLLMNVTTRLANGTTSTSPSSTFQFFTGAPNTTTLRIVEVTEASFKIRWKPSMFATGYVINVRNHTFSQNFTAPISTEYVMEGLLIEGVTYDVTIASFNRFGMSGFSPAKTTRFWWFSGITNSSFALDWLNEPSDLQYRVVTMPTTSNPNNYTSNHVTFVGLDAGIAYRVNVSYLDVSATWTLLFSTIQITVPGQPRSLAQSFSNLTSVGVSWDDVTGAESYYVVLKTFREEKELTLSSVHASFSNLNAGRFYEVVVQAINAAGRGYYAAISAETTKDIPTITSTSDDLTSSTFTVRWTPALHASNYVVYATNLNTSSVSSYNVTMTSLMLVGLSSGSTYAVSVAASYETGLSPTSGVRNQLTVPAPPANITTSFTSNRRDVSLTWDSPFGAEAYDVVVTENGAVYITTRASVNRYDLINLCGDVGYNVTIASVNAAGKRDATRTSFIADRFVPENLVVANVTTSSMIVNWTKIKCAIAYQVRAISGNFWLTHVNATETDGSATLSDLQPGRLYSLTVRALYRNGWSSSSSPIAQITVPGNPTNFTAANVNASAVRVIWDEVVGVDIYEYVFDGVSGSTPTSEARFTSLQPGSSYLLRVRSANAAGKGRFVAYNVTTVPAAPTNVGIGRLPNGDVTLTWSSPFGSTIYGITLVSLTNPSIPPFSGQVDQNRYDATDLCGGAGYQANIEAINAAGASEPAVIQFNAGLPVPKDLLVTGVDSTSITASWARTTCATNYQISAESGHFSSSRLTANHVNVTIPDLKPGTNYSLTVRAQYESGLSSSLERVYQLTLPSSPSNVRVTFSSGGYEALIEWNVTLSAIAYDVILQEAGYHIRTATNKVMVNTTCGDKQYNARIFAVNAAGKSQPSNFQFTTERLAPKNIAIKSITTNTVRLNLDPIDCIELFQAEAVSGELRFFTNATTGVGIALRGLEPARNYTISARALYANGWSPLSEHVSLTTATSNPPYLNVDHVTSSSVSISWTNQQPTAWAYRVLVVHFGVVIRTVDYDAMTNTTVVPSLGAGKSYNFSVRAISNVGHGLPLYENTQQAPQALAITATLPPSNVSVLDLAGSQVTIKWLQPVGAIRFYIVLSSDFSDGNRIDSNYTTEGLELHIANLPSTAISYTVTVQAFNKQDVLSEKSVPVTFMRQENQTNLPGWAIALIVLAILAVLVGIGVYVAWRKYKMKTQGVYNLWGDERQLELSVVDLSLKGEENNHD